MKKYRYFLFDLDGTLTDSAPGVTKSVQYALESYGIHVENPDELRCFVGPPLTDSFRRYCDCGEEDAVLLREKYRERYNPIGIYENSVIPGIPEVLEGIHARGGKIAVASSKPEVMVRRVLDRFDLSRWFDEIVGSELNGVREAKEEVIGEVFRRMGLDEANRSQVLMIGDRRYDVLGARACGVDCLGAYIGYAEPGELEEAGADYVAASMEEMTRLLFEAAEA